MAICEICNASNYEDAKFCNNCGKPMLLKTRYNVLGQVGRGGFGVVYKAKDTLRNDQIVAIKEMKQSDIDNNELIDAINKFKGEARMLADLEHPNLPRIHDHFSDTGHWYLVMDFIEGETLEDYLSRTEGYKLSVEDTIEIGIQLCSILDYLHTHKPPIIFRDLNPANIMLTPQKQIYLIDFGIARHFKTGLLYTEKLGKEGYAAPEQYNTVRATLLTDIYALGATLHHLLSGEHPLSNGKRFYFKSLKLYNPLIPTKLDVLIMQMLKYNKDERPNSAIYIKHELEGIYAYLKASSSLDMPFPLQPISQVPLHVFTEHQKEVYSVAWSPDSQFLASASGDRTLRIWNILKREISSTYKYRRAIKVVAWSPDGQRLAYMGIDQVIQVKNIITGDITSYNDHVTSGIGFAFAMAWSPDGKYIASGSDNSKVFLWDGTSKNLLSVYSGHRSWISAIAWSPEGKYIASGSNDKTVQVWEVASGTTISTYTNHAGEISAIAWSPDSGFLASAYKDHINIWDDINNEKPLIVYEHHKGVNALAWSLDSMYLASAGNDRTIGIWDTSLQKKLPISLKHSAPVRAVTWSPDGKYLASADEDKQVYLWEIK